MWTSIKKHLFENELFKFRFGIISRLVAIPLFSMILNIVFVILFLQFNLIFFEANGYPQVASFKETFYDFIFARLLVYLPYTFGFLILLSFLGVYVSRLLVRPFKLISEYCADFMQGKRANYDPEFLTDLKLLTSFSEWFFNSVENSVKNKTLPRLEVPKKFQKIHRPIFETSFFLHYSFLLSLGMIAVGFGVHMFAIDAHENLIELSRVTLKDAAGINYFMRTQSQVFTNVTWFTLTVHLLLHIFLLVRLHEMVATPAFALFSTMRSFVKGSHDVKVHLVGHYFLRDYFRTFNQYLTYVKNSIGDEKK